MRNLAFSLFRSPSPLLQLTDCAVEQIELRLIDDPKNTRVFKGPGHYAATRAQAAIHKLQQAFPQLQFKLASDAQLSSLRATAEVAEPIPSDEFIAALKDAMDATGVRIAPLPRDMRPPLPLRALA